MFREADLIDVWFDSGSMPYAQWHYPFENKEFIDKKVFILLILSLRVSTKQEGGFTHYMQ